VRHSEFNASRTHPVHFLQIWIQPDVSDISPSYEEKRFEAGEKRGRLRLIASKDGDSNSVRVHQDVRVYGGLFDGSEQADLEKACQKLIDIANERGGLDNVTAILVKTL